MKHERDGKRFSRRDRLGEFDEENCVEADQFIGDFLRELLSVLCGVILITKIVLTQFVVRIN